jgi:hypothetical protein
MDALSRGMKRVVPFSFLSFELQNRVFIVSSGLRTQGFIDRFLHPAYPFSGHNSLFFFL